MIKMQQLVSKYGIKTAPKGDRHARQGWLQFACPFCHGNKGYYLGWNLAKGYFNCWRCGWKPLYTTLAKLLSVGTGKAADIAKQFGGFAVASSDSQKAVNRPHTLKMPQGTGALQKQHRAYLESRNFDPDELTMFFDLQGTGALGKYRNRVIAPILWLDKRVSYTGRDITGNHKLRYMSCPMDAEVMPHKELLYCSPVTLQTEHVIIVEGIADTWRWPRHAVGLFGIDYNAAQVWHIAQFWRRCTVLFDSEMAAQVKAQQLAADLESLEVSVDIMTLEPSDFRHGGKDPGDLSPKRARKILSELADD